MLNYCCEPVDRIEGYISEEKRAVKMVIHHRLESHDESGTLRTRFLSMQQLKDAGLYYNRPASELICLKKYLISSKLNILWMIKGKFLLNG